MIGVYEDKNINNGKKILIYNPSSYNKAFYIKYRINNITVKHNDIGELSWEIIGEEFNEPIENFKATIHIPTNTNINAWVHGDAYGKINIIDNETVFITTTNLNSNTPIDVRITFDSNVINQSNKTTNTNALDKIILYETNNQNKTTEEQIASQYIKNLEVNLERYYYETAFDYISNISDQNIRDKYLNKLSELKSLLDKKEEQNAIEAIEKINISPTYPNYKYAMTKILTLDNEITKSNLLIKLTTTEELIKKEEIKKEIINYFGF